MKTTAFFILLLLLPLPLCAQVAFTDVTQTAGVANSLGNQTRLATHAAWGDYDGDGRLDLYVTNWGSSVSQSTNRLYRNLGDGRFSDVATQAGVNDGFRNSVDAHWIDFDNDGNLDLYVTDFFAQDRLYRNNGNGAFTNVTAQAGVNVIAQGDETAAAWGDYNNDGFIDLYITKNRFRNALYRNNGDGTFSEIGVLAGVADIRDSQHAVWGDYDNNGRLDLYVVNREQNNTLYRNNGDGTFVEIAGLLGLDNTDIGKSATWIDYDNDGRLDLFVANVGANALYKNLGNDQFVDVAAGALKVAATGWVSWVGIWGDFTRNGRPDLFIATGADSRAGQVSPLLRNDGGDAFTDITAGSGLKTVPGNAMSAAAADFDGDGDLDLYIVNSRFPSFDGNLLFRNDTAP